VPSGDQGSRRRPFSADRGPVAQVFDIAADDDRAIFCLKRGADVVAAIGSVSACSGFNSRGDKLLNGEHVGSLAEGKVEVPSGFEPLNIGFADRPLRPLGHGTFWSGDGTRTLARTLSIGVRSYYCEAKGRIALKSQASAVLTEPHLKGGRSKQLWPA
jgi:hypothetical protein